MATIDLRTPIQPGNKILSLFGTLEDQIQMSTAIGMVVGFLHTQNAEPDTDTCDALGRLMQLQEAILTDLPHIIINPPTLKTPYVWTRNKK